MSAPRVLGETNQPPSPREARELAARLKALAPVPHEAQLVYLLGKVATAPQHQVHEEVQEVTGLLGTEGINQTAGWGKWAKVARMQRTALTVLEEYEPVMITLPLILDVGVATPRNGKGEPEEDIEEFVNRLEWMGGRGTLFRGEPAQAGEGETPLISIGSNGALVPNWLQQGKGGGKVLWVLEKLEWNTLGREWILPLRHERTGRRIRQALTLSLIEYSGAPNARYDSTAQRVNVLHLQSATRLITVGGGLDSFIAIAKYLLGGAEHSRIPDAAREIQKANPRYGTDLYKALPRGARIQVPETATKRRF